MSKDDLDRDTLNAECDPANLLDQVRAQLKISGAWMTEHGLTPRCSLAKKQAEVVGALIELERRGEALSEGRDSNRPLWRIAQGKKLPEAPTQSIPAAKAKATPWRKFRIKPQTTHTTTTPAPVRQEIQPMSNTRKNAEQIRAAIIAAIKGGAARHKDIKNQVGCSGSALHRYAAALIEEGVIQKAPGKRGEYSLGAGGAVERLSKGISKASKSAERKNSYSNAPGVEAVEDLDIKLAVLDQAAKDAGTESLRAAALSAIRADLVRFASAG